MTEKTTESKRQRYAPAHVIVRERRLGDEIESIRRYVRSVTSFFALEFHNYRASLIEMAQGAPPDAIQSLGEDLVEAEHELVDHFPAITLCTTFVSTYTLMEDEMLGLARAVGRQLGDTREPEGKEKGIFAAKKFFEGHGLSFPAGRAWDEAVAHNAIRDALVHCRGWLQSSRKAPQIREYIQGKYVQGNPKITIDEHTDHIRLTEAFCMDVLDNVEALMGELFVTVRGQF